MSLEKNVTVPGQVTFNITEIGKYVLEGFHDSPHEGANSVRINQGSAAYSDSCIWDMPIGMQMWSMVHRRGVGGGYDDWKEDPWVLDFPTPGSYTFFINAREPQTKLYKLRLVKLSAANPVETANQKLKDKVGLTDEEIATFPRTT